MQALNSVAPIVVCAALGWAWVRGGRPFDRSLITRLVTDLGAPCLVFASLSGVGTPLDQLADLALAAFVAIAATAGLAAVLLRVLGLPLDTYLAPLTFGNAGNLGIGLCLFAFGPIGLALAVAYYAVSSLIHFTLGISIWSGALTFRELARTPILWAALLAVVCLVFEFPVPVWLSNATTLLGGITVPLMLLALGASLHDLQFAAVPRVAGLSVARLALGFGVGLSVSAALGLEGEVRAVLIVQSSMPVAVFNYLFAERYGRSPQIVASLVVLSTLIAFPLLPLLLSYLL